MLFNTDEFIFFFLPVVLAGFFLLGRLGAHRACLLWLVAASLFYYGWWDPRYLILVGGSMMFNYTLGSYIALANHQVSQRKAKTLATVGVLANLALLGYYKYANFFLDNLDGLVGQDWSLGEIILPIGISFFTFQQIAYLVDAYKGETKEYDFVQYALFVMFFPQLIAGPIVHHKEMLPQFARVHTYRPRWSNIAVGSTIFIIGLAKKLLLADNLAPRRCSSPPARAMSCRFFRPGKARSPTVYSSILTSPATRTWRSAWPVCLAFACRSTSTPPTKPLELLISGAGGT